MEGLDYGAMFSFGIPCFSFAVYEPSKRALVVFKGYVFRQRGMRSDVWFCIFLGTFVLGLLFLLRLCNYLHIILCNDR